VPSQFDRVPRAKLAVDRGALETARLPHSPVVCPCAEVKVAFTDAVRALQVLR